MTDMVVRCLKFSQNYFLILLHQSTLQQCYYIKTPNNDLKSTKFTSKKQQQNIEI